MLSAVALAAAAVSDAVGFRQTHLRTSVNPLGYAESTATYRSNAMPLAPGGVVFTDKNSFVLPFPKPGRLGRGAYAITQFGPAEVVDDSGRSVPLDEVYNHHWLIFNSKGNSGVCGDFLSYIFGVGAESRRTPTVFPPGYGYVTSGAERWTGNIHLLRTESLLVLPGENMSNAVKMCIECQYAPGKNCKPGQTGQFACCQTGAKCPTVPNAGGKKNYYLQYTVTWTEDVGAIKPAHMYLLDASNCQVEYNVYPGAPNNVKVTEFSWKAQVTGDIILAVGHLHAGAVGISFAVNGVTKCSVKPVYGTQASVPGNEKGYLVEMPPCPGTEVLHVTAGSKMTVRSEYWVGWPDPTGSGFPGGFHGGVMSYMYVAYSTQSMVNTTGHPIVDPRTVKWEPFE